MAVSQKWPVHDFGYQPYETVQRAMDDWLSSQKPSQIWVGEHPLVISRGVRAWKDLRAHPFPSVRSSRGGLMSLHLPGQLVFYPLYRQPESFDIQKYVALLEETVLCYLSQWPIAAFRCESLPGIYTSRGKMSSLGLRAKKQGIIHGLSLNVCCPLQPFEYIENCGSRNIPMTNLAAHGIFPMLSSVKKELAAIFLTLLHAKEACYVD